MPAAAPANLDGKRPRSTRNKPDHPNFVGNARSVYNFERLSVIGEGTYGVVYRARDKETKQIVALKKLRMEREKEGMPLTSLREIRLLRASRHPNVVQLLEIAVGNKLDSIFLVLEYCENDLAVLLDKAMKRKFTESEVKCLMQQLLRAVAYMHDHWMIHRDIKMSNLLYNNRGCLKLADFGLARLFGYPKKPYTPRVVTLWYRAPELLLCDRKLQEIFVKEAERQSANDAAFAILEARALEEKEKAAGSASGEAVKGGQAVGMATAQPPPPQRPPQPLYSTGVDTWSIGCIFAELLGGEPLFPADTEIDLVGRLFRLLGTPTEAIWPDFPSLWPSFSTRAASQLGVEGASQPYNLLAKRYPQLSASGLALLKGSLCYDPIKRLSCAAALQHPYFTESPRPQDEAMMPTFPAAHELQKAEDERLKLEREKQRVEEEARRRGRDIFGSSVESSLAAQAKLRRQKAAERERDERPRGGYGGGGERPYPPRSGDKRRLAALVENS